MIDHDILARNGTPPGATADGARGAGREDGSVLVFFLVMLIPLAALAVAATSFGARRTAEDEAQRIRRQAFLNAESGVDHAMAQLLDDATNLDTLTVFYDGDESIRYQVAFEDLGDDGVDNDSDGDVDESDEDSMVRLVSSGTVNVSGFDMNGDPVAAGPKSFVKQIQAYGRKLDSLPDFPWAVYLGDPFAEIQLNGNSFMIDGNDYATDFSASGNPPVPGVATVGDADEIIDQVSHQQNDNIVGEGGFPSIHETAEVDIQSIIDEYKSFADIKFTGADNQYNGMLGDPDTGDYKVTYAQGNLDMSGNGGGAGLLLVEGNLEITGGWDYKGIVIVTGQVIFRGGGGGKRILGTLLVGGDVIAGNPGQDEDLEISGTVDILYSSEVQQEIGEAVSDFTLFGWQEL